MNETRAAIDMGTHTARLLIARRPGVEGGGIRPLARKRAYIRLGEGFDSRGRRTIQPDAIERTLDVMGDFQDCLREFNVHSVHAVATGVVRDALNRDLLLERIMERSGISVRPISGEEEARLTGKGVISALNVRAAPFLIFDLGGGSTEFIFGGGKEPALMSVPLGAAILHNSHLKSDPPDEDQISSLSGYIDQCLKEARLEDLRGEGFELLLGTGGTVTTLAAMLHHIDTREISPDRINGLKIGMKGIQGLFNEIRGMSARERLKLTGLDPGRAEVITAGALAVIRIMTFFRSVQLEVSVSDLLEGIILSCFEGE